MDIELSIVHVAFGTSDLGEVGAVDDDRPAVFGAQPDDVIEVLDGAALGRSGER